MFEKLKFWEKEESDLGLPSGEAPMFGEEPKLPGLEPGAEFGMPGESAALGAEPSFEHPSAPEAPAFGKAESMPGFEQPTGSERPEAFQPMQQQQQLNITPDMLSKDLQIISSKLDTVKAQLENMSQRIANIEKKAYEEDRHSEW